MKNFLTYLNVFKGAGKQQMRRGADDRASPGLLPCRARRAAGGQRLRGVLLGVPDFVPTRNRFVLLSSALFLTT